MKLSSFTFTFHTSVPAGVVTALNTVLTALQAAAAPGVDDTLIASKLGEVEALVNRTYTP